MPSQASITAFYVFAPSTKARSTQLNHNFGIWRGHVLPVDPTSASPADQTYDLGVSPYRWRAAYVSKWSLSVSSGSSNILQGTTAGAFKWVKDGTTTAELAGDYFVGHMATPISPTTAASYGGYARSNPVNTTVTSDQFIAGSTCTLSTNGRPIKVGMIEVGGTTGSSGLFISAQTTTVNKFFVRVSCYANLAADLLWTNEVSIGYTTTGMVLSNHNFSPAIFEGITFAYSTSTALDFQLKIEAPTTSVYTQFTIELRNVRLGVKEL